MGFLLLRNRDEIIRGAEEGETPSTEIGGFPCSPENSCDEIILDAISFSIIKNRSINGYVRPAFFQGKYGKCPG